MSLLIVHKRRQRPLLLVFDRLGLEKHPHVWHTWSSLLFKSNFSNYVQKCLRCVSSLLLTHILVTTAYVALCRRWQHGCPQLYHTSSALRTTTISGITVFAHVICALFFYFGRWKIGVRKICGFLCVEVLMWVSF